MSCVRLYYRRKQLMPLHIVLKFMFCPLAKWWVLYELNYVEWVTQFVWWIKLCIKVLCCLSCNKSCELDLVANLLNYQAAIILNDCSDSRLRAEKKTLVKNTMQLSELIMTMILLLNKIILNIYWWWWFHDTFWQCNTGSKYNNYTQHWCPVYHSYITHACQGALQWTEHKYVHVYV